jgi:flagellar basal body-associated protein FliL
MSEFKSKRKNEQAIMLIVMICLIAALVLGIVLLFDHGNGSARL